MNGVPVLVRHDLELDVVRVDDQLLDVKRAIAESFYRFVARGDKRRAETGFVVRRAHAAAAAARDRFDHHGKTDAPRHFQRFLFVLDDAVTAWRNRHAGFPRTSARRILVPHRVHRAGGWPDKLDLATLADFREVRVLGEKSIAGMDRIHVAHFGRAHDPIDFQIALRTRRRADADGFVGELDVERIDIRFGINGERADAEFLARADDAQRDLAPVCD